MTVTIGLAVFAVACLVVGLVLLGIALCVAAKQGDQDFDRMMELRRAQTRDLDAFEQPVAS